MAILKSYFKKHPVVYKSQLLLFTNILNIYFFLIKMHQNKYTEPETTLSPKTTEM